MRAKTTEPLAVKDYMTAIPVTFTLDTEVFEAIQALVKNELSGAPVVDLHGNLVGIFSEQDCIKVGLRAAYHNEWTGKVSEFMGHGVKSVDPDMSLVELIVERGEDAVDQLPKGLRENPEAMAETIENNIRKVIIDEMAVNPKYYEKMSELLDALIQARKKEAMDYKVYLAKIVELTRKAKGLETDSSYPAIIDSSARRALYDNLDQKEELAVGIDKAIRNVKKAGWRGNRFKEREVKIAIKSVLGTQDPRIDSVFEMVKNQREY
ncbi:MAG: CBS domain-containing protein [Deltaproteobacteria bacterium]|nr:CBS domain-containing protein [Deltaproteobacteria bacterium]